MFNIHEDQNIKCENSNKIIFDAFMLSLTKKNSLNPCFHQLIYSFFWLYIKILDAELREHHYSVAELKIAQTVC